MSALGQKRTYAVQNGMSALPPKATSNATFGTSAKGQKQTLLRFLAFCRRCPYASKYSNESDDQIESDRFTNQLCGEQSCRDGVEGHRIRYSGWRRPFEGQHPKDERERAATNPEIDTSNPLRDPKRTQDGNAAC